MLTLWTKVVVAVEPQTTRHAASFLVYMDTCVDYDTNVLGWTVRKQPTLHSNNNSSLVPTTCAGVSMFHKPETISTV